MAIDPQPDCYAILGVPANAEDGAIRAAFDALAERYDPAHFAGPEDEAHRRMSELTGAFEILADPVRRRRYDLHRRIDAWTAPLHVSDPSEDMRPPSTVVSPDSVAETPRRNRMPLFVLIAAVVVLAALAVFSGRLKEWLGSRPPAPPIAADAKPASGAPPSSTAAKIPEPPAAAKVLPEPPAAAAVSGAGTAPAAVPQAAATPPQEAKPAPAKPAAARNVPTNRPANAAPGAAASERCSDVLTALGLCKRSPTVKDK